MKLMGFGVNLISEGELSGTRSRRGFAESMEDPTASFNLEILVSVEDIHCNWYFSIN